VPGDDALRAAARTGRAQDLVPGRRLELALGQLRRDIAGPADFVAVGEIDCRLQAVGIKPGRSGGNWTPRKTLTY